MAIFNGLINFVAGILAFMYQLPVVGGNYGVAVILLTLVVMVVLMPLTLKATRSTIKMQQIQPELKRLQKAHKDDRQTLNTAVMKLYSDNGISPVGGCLPMLAQLPVFLVLFRVLQGLTRRIEDRHFFDLANRLREARGLPPENGRFFDPKYVSKDSELYQDLRTDTEMTFGPIDLAERALDVLRADFVAALPYILLIAFVVGSSYYQQRQISARRTNDPGAEVSPMMQQQQMLLKVLPLMSGVWSFLFPAGLVLYWATSNLFRIGQQTYITHQIYGKEAPEIEADAERKQRERELEAEQEKQAASTKPRPSTSTKKKPKKTPSKNGSSDADEADKTETVGASTADRNQRWEQLREKKQTKAKTKSKQRATGGTSSRVTPKGTKAGANKKKRKR